jgi:ATP-binding cassette subfamily B protein
VAIVGPNGSGKTTLVKLLCRLYDPDEGRVMVNGSDASSLDPASYRRLFSVVFQNFMLYYLSAGENIMLGSRDSGDGGDHADRGDRAERNGSIGSADGAGRNGNIGFSAGAERSGGNSFAMGEGQNRDDSSAVDLGRKVTDNSGNDAGESVAGKFPNASDELRKAAGTTGLRELLEALPEGYNTQLGHHTEGGHELSWGEWQKIAIARAIWRPSPVLILDEPASSLDADSEYEIFSDLSRITGGRTCIFISHRLSNVRDADRIIVLDGGRIAEAGTHDELMAAGGRYYNMFTRQKSMYR